MRFADGFLVLSLVILVVVAAVGAFTLLARRAGRSGPRLPLFVWAGLGVTAVLLLAQAVVVDAVEDRAEGAAGGLGALDEPVLTWFVAHRNGFWTGIGIVLASIGGTAAMTLLTVVATLVLVYLRRRDQAVVVALTAIGSGALVYGFKSLYGRNRPPPVEAVIHYAGHSLPSGHALGSTVVLGIVAAAIYPNLRAGRARRTLVFSAVTLALLVGVSRIYLAAHWLTDVLTGWLLGGAWLAAAVTVLTWRRNRDTTAEPVVTSR